MAADEAAVNHQPIAKPSVGMSNETEGSAEVLLSLSYEVILSNPVALYTPIAQRRTVVLRVTTIFPVVPVGTAAITIAAQSEFVTLFVTCLTIVAVTPPTVIPDRVKLAQAFLATARTMICLSATAVHKFCEEKVYILVSVVSVAD